MIDHPNLESAEVAVIKRNTPIEGVLEGIEKLGGITKFINEGDQVFIKFNLNLPYGFPTNTNFNVLKVLIKSCKKAGADKIYLGSFPVKGVPINTISKLLDINSYIENFGAELVFLDNSNYYDQKGLKPNHLKEIKENSFSTLNVNNKEVKVPNIILNSDKLIIVNQVNVEPLFKCTLSILNSYSIIPNKYQEIEKSVREGKDYLFLDQYKQDLISNIIDVFTIKKPDLVINDLFYLMEEAGPYIYKDSKLKTTGLVIVGSDAIAVDLITLWLMNIDMIDSKLILEAHNKRVGMSDISKINIVGEKLENFKINVNFCASKLESIKINNFSVKSGRYCSGCFKYAYHLLNIIKTHMVKDLKYNPFNSFLFGENPLDPENSNNIILFGDCCINSTKNYSFRKIIKKTHENISKESTRKLYKKSKSSQKRKTKEILNKNILELPGCPPDIFDSLKLLLDYFGEKNAPNLRIINELLKSWRLYEVKEKLEIWEAL
ncbi:MAG: DUF362 domain-containing protein [Promethearchaeota archaeon]